MDENPTTRRRWYQFRLSTVLVLVAICAWAMSCWPWVSVESRVVPGRLDGPPLTFELWADGIYMGPYVDQTWHVNMNAIWPAFALLAFLAWNWTWPRVVRWRRRRNQPAAAESPR